MRRTAPGLASKSPLSGCGDMVVLASSAFLIESHVECGPPSLSVYLYWLQILALLPTGPRADHDQADLSRRRPRSRSLRAEPRLHAAALEADAHAARARRLRRLRQPVQPRLQQPAVCPQLPPSGPRH